MKKSFLMLLLAVAGLIFASGCTPIDDNENYDEMLKDYGQDYNPSTE